MFRTKYGANADFNGYIDKFYSQEVFHLDNVSILKEIANEVLYSINYDSRDVHEETYFRGKFNRRMAVAADFLSLMVEYGCINLRTLMARIKNNVSVSPNQTVNFNSRFSLSLDDYSFLFQFIALGKIVGGFDILREYINQIPDRRLIITNSDCNQLLYFSNYRILMQEGHTYSVTLGEKQLFFDRVMRAEDLEKMMVFDKGMEGGNSQYSYSTRERLMLLNDFIDVLAQSSISN